MTWWWWWWLCRSKKQDLTLCVGVLCRPEVDEGGIWVNDGLSWVGSGDGHDVVSVLLRINGGGGGGGGDGGGGLIVG